MFFDEPIPQVHFMKLISCSLYNSWDTLKNEGTLSIVETNGTKVSKIPKGHIDLEAFKESLEGLLKVYNYELKTDIYTPKGQLLIQNRVGTPLRIDRDLAEIFDIGRELKNRIITIKRLKYPTAYFIYCDLIDRNFNFFNNKKSDFLAKIDVKGRPYEKVRYDASPQQAIRDCSTSSHVNSTTISVKDKDGELFDFKDLQLKFELEIN